MNKKLYKFFLVFLAVLVVASVSIPFAGAHQRTAFAEGFSINGKAAYLVDYDTGTVIFKYNENEKYQIASMVKIMTSLLAFEAIESGNLRLDEQIVISEAASGMGGSQVFLDAGTSHKVEDLLESLAVAAANDSSVAIAERIAGSEMGFVKLMNKRAKELNMQSTLFSNCTGLPNPGQYSTAHDVSIMTRELSRFPKYKEFCSVWMKDYQHPDGRVTTITNTNKLVRFYKGCDCGKKGFTSEAMFCLSASQKETT
jgi:D-alanyl-D-alanine carboxypeptidase (penicillin-binding protein 5/6)